ncbi:MAG TPA: sugar phosphate isomerase/epimerase [Candidatus Hydrogenedentes bacterium]|nr:sugar phosphate isomerase/epimerase [Candidatus Hydrogenedentota bacterium]HPG70246.1 sugar phosphate isomerase/epimerase [Candidatus Hydrogenedentota bacterium]
MASTISRRRFLQAGTGGSLALAASAVAETPVRKFQEGVSPWPLCLNTSTIRPATLEQKVECAIAAGYDGVEPWVNDLEAYEQEGKSLEDLAKRIRDAGLFVPNIIGLWNAMPPTEEAFEASLEGTRNRMRLAAAIGSQHAAAIPAPDREDFDLKWGAEMYRRLLEIGRKEFGIIVAFEFVGFMKGVHRLGQASAVALDANDPDACLIADTFHLFRGDSGFEGVRHLDGGFIADFHWNDVPAEPPREEQGDTHRIYPGDGILPLEKLMRDLVAIDYRGPLSLEMFNEEHYKQDPMVVAKTGLQKMRDQITRALA